MSEVDYSTGKIYRLLCVDGYYYIGSTKNKLNYRLNNHKYLSKNSNAEVYKHINNIGWENVTIELVENCPCETRDELLKRENYFIQQQKNDPLCLNVNRCFVSKEEKKELAKKYYEENKETILEQHQEYLSRPEIKEKTNEYHAKYREENAEKRRAYSRQYVIDHPEEVKEARKQYYEANKEKITKKNKEYVEKNKEKVQERKKAWAEKKKLEDAPKVEEERKRKKEEKLKRKEEKKLLDETPVECECGGTYQPYRKSRHDKGKKHIAFTTKNKGL